MDNKTIQTITVLSTVLTSVYFSLEIYDRIQRIKERKNLNNGEA